MNSNELKSEVPNFKIEELEPRLEMAKWSAYSEEIPYYDENGESTTVYGATLTIPF